MEKKMSIIEIRGSSDVWFTCERGKRNIAEELRSLLNNKEESELDKVAEEMMEIELRIWKAIGEKGDVKDPDGKAVTPLTHEIWWEFVDNTRLVPYIQPKKVNEIL